MFTVFSSTLTPMLMMFFCIVVGYLLNKLHLLPENAGTVMSKLETYALVPARNIYTFMTYCTVSSLYSHRYYLLFSSGLIAVGIGIAYPLSKLFAKEGYERNIYKYALTFGNFGFLSNAIVPVILGEEFLYTYMLFTLPLTTMCYVWGLNILIPDKDNGKKKNPLRNLLNPCVISIPIGAVIGLCGASSFVPEFLKMTLSGLSDCMGPIAMVLTGFVIAKFKMSELLLKPYVYLASLFRLVLLPAVFIGALLLFHADRNIIMMCMFAFATPMGLNTIVFPTTYGGDPLPGASMALISHTLCIISIPLFYAVLTLIT